MYVRVRIAYNTQYVLIDVDFSSFSIDLSELFNHFNACRNKFCKLSCHVISHLTREGMVTKCKTSVSAAT